MRRLFTPASHRALAAAARWRSRSHLDDPGLPELLIGLLAESECRAAAMLMAQGIDLAAVRAQWPDLEEIGDLRDAPSMLSPAWEDALRAAEVRLCDLPQPLALATEHLLLGLLECGGEVSQWLLARHVDGAALRSDIERRYARNADAAFVAGARYAESVVDEPIGPDPLPIEPCDATLDDQQRAALIERDRVSVMRVIDAAENRAREGLRTAEDYVRYVLDDAHLTGELKHLRHELTIAARAFAPGDRHAGRETQADVGCQIASDSEMVRGDVSEVVAAAFKRVAEALRSLEEFGKLLDPGTAAQVEQLRYRAYTLERAVDVTRRSIERLADARLYVLVDGRQSIDAFARLATGLVAAGVDMIQLRVKRLDDRQLLDRANRLRQITRGTRTLFIMNDRPDLAAIAAADGVHVGQKELAVKDVRRVVGPRALIGVSTHSLEQARQAVLDGANYIGVGPTFPSATKHFAEHTGLELVQAVANEIRLPAFAIGGVDRHNLAKVLAAGVHRVAVSGAVLAAADPVAAAVDLLTTLRACPP